MKKYYSILSILAVLLFSISLKSQSKEVSFKIKNAGFNVEGFFEKYTLNISYNEANVASSTFKGEVQVTSINTDSKKRDNHLRQADYFNVAKFPTITFVSSKVQSIGSAKIKVTGDITIKGKRKSVTMDVTVRKVNGKNEFTASLPLNRLEFGVGESSFMLSDNLTVYFKVVR